MRLRARPVSCNTGSMPACTRIAAAASAPRWARAPAPSVTLTASARPRSGKACARNSFASQVAGGATSAVRTNRPDFSVASRRVPAPASFGAFMDGADNFGLPHRSRGTRAKPWRWPHRNVLPLPRPLQTADAKAWASGASRVADAARSAHTRNARQLLCRGGSMAYLDVNPMIASLRARPDDFEMDRGWLQHTPSRHSFKFDEAG